MAIGLLSAGISAVGAMAAGNAQASQAEYNAQVARINAQTARQEGQAQSERIGAKHDTTRGQAVAAAGKAGVDPFSGSAAQVIFQEGGENRYLDQQNAIWNKQTEAIGFENKAKALDADAKNARKGAMFGAAGSFLTGLGGAAKKSDNSLFLNG